MKAPNMEGRAARTHACNVAEPNHCIHSGNQGGHAYNVAEPNHCKGARSARETKPQARNVRGARGGRRRGGRRRREDAIEEVLLERIQARDEHEHRHRLAFGPDALACACKDQWQSVAISGMSIGIVSPSVRMHLPVHASSSGALRESIKRHLEQGALTGIMLDSRRGLSGGCDRHHH